MSFPKTSMEFAKADAAKREDGCRERSRSSKASWRKKLESNKRILSSIYENGEALLQDRDRNECKHNKYHNCACLFSGTKKGH